MTHANDNDAITTRDLIPVLVSCAKETCDGRVAFPGKRETAYGRVLPADALGMAVSKDASKRDTFVRNFGVVSEKGMKHLRYVLSLMSAVHRADVEALRRAVKQYTRETGEPDSVHVDGIGRLPFFSEEFDRIWEDMPSRFEKRQGRKVRVMLPLWTLHREVNSGIAGVQFVVWWNVHTRSFQPGLWCEDLLMALHALALAHITKVGGTSICLRCGDWFRRLRRGQTYCSYKCRVASAMARMRERERAAKLAVQTHRRSKGRKKQGGKRGTRKTR